MTAEVLLWYHSLGCGRSRYSSRHLNYPFARQPLVEAEIKTPTFGLHILYRYLIPPHFSISNTPLIPDLNTDLDGLETLLSVWPCPPVFGMAGRGRGYWHLVR